MATQDERKKESACSISFHHPGEGRGPIGKVVVTERNPSFCVSQLGPGLRRGGAYVWEKDGVRGDAHHLHFIAASMSLIGTNAKPTELSAIPYGMKIVSPCFNAPQL